MTSLSSACRLTARISATRLQSVPKFRGLRTSSAILVAQNFTMPALSPTMTEGNISKWNIKEGESFSAGDVLLEIETDKASMDVEAQDDGIVAKIFQGDGCKGIKVGTRIGILAEAGDDLSTLDLSPEDTPTASSLKKVTEDLEREKTSQVNGASSLDSHDMPQTSGDFSSGKKQTYPLLPSVQHLLHLHGLNHSTIDKMTPTGPNNRLLKGDVLAYLGQVSKSYPSELSSKISSLSHLDLSNIKIKAPEPAPKVIQAIDPKKSHEEATVSLEQPVSFEKIRKIQDTMVDTLGFSMPDEAFILQASRDANKSIPRPKSLKATPNEMFDSILGLSSLSKEGLLSKEFSPSLRPDTHVARTCSSNPEVVEDCDIIDILIGKAKPLFHGSDSNTIVTIQKSNLRTFTLQVAKDEEDRAKLFLAKLKSILENHPRYP